MSLGAILVGIAVAMVVLAYIAHPFRKITVSPDDVIETWIREHGRVDISASSTPPRHAPPPSPVETPDSTPAPVRATRAATLPSNTDTHINFCPQCGRKVAPDHRFCPGCGYQLLHEEDEA